VTAVFRLVRERHARDAFSGEGARALGGRWNPPGFAVVYASESRALAALETLVHVTHEARSLHFVMFVAQLPDGAAIERYQGSIEAWRQPRPTSASQRAGREWLARSRSLAFAVPSVIVPEETNYVLNVEHADFSRVRISGPVPFSFDERLWPA
jgi:RES domain-containing protein